MVAVVQQVEGEVATTTKDVRVVVALVEVERAAEGAVEGETEAGEREGQGGAENASAVEVSVVRAEWQVEDQVVEMTEVAREEKVEKVVGERAGGGEVAAAKEAGEQGEAGPAKEAMVGEARAVGDGKGVSGEDAVAGALAA